MEIWELATPAYGHSCSKTKAPHTTGNSAAISLQRCRSTFRLKVRGYSTRIEVYSEEPIETLGLIFRGHALRDLSPIFYRIHFSVCQLSEIERRPPISLRTLLGIRRIKSEVTPILSKMMGLTQFPRKVSVHVTESAVSVGEMLTKNWPIPFPLAIRSSIPPDKPLNLAQ